MHGIPRKWKWGGWCNSGAPTPKPRTREWGHGPCHTLGPGAQLAVVASSFCWGMLLHWHQGEEEATAEHPCGGRVMHGGHQPQPMSHCSRRWRMAGGWNGTAQEVRGPRSSMLHKASLPATPFILLQPPPALPGLLLLTNGPPPASCILHRRGSTLQHGSKGPACKHQTPQSPSHRQLHQRHRPEESTRKAGRCIPRAMDRSKPCSPKAIGMGMARGAVHWMAM